MSQQLSKNFNDLFNSKNHGPERFKEIVKECWYVSDNTHTSYTDVLDLSIQEKIYIIDCINTKIEKTKIAINESAKELRAGKK